MTIIFLLRHAHSQANQAGILAGQTPGVHLSVIGKKEARAFAKDYRNMRFDEIHISPLARCLETITPYLQDQLRKRGRKINVLENRNFIEMDYGSWSGVKLSKLALRPLWGRIQKNPYQVTFPGGESFASLNKRVKKGLLEIGRKSPKSNVLIVTHGDVIKVAVAIALEMEFNNFQKIAIDPASITAIEVKKRGFRIIAVNSKTEPIILGGKRFALGGGSGANRKKP